MIEVTLKELLEGRNALNKLLNAELPVKVAFGLSKTVKVVNGEFKTFDEQRQALVKKYGEEDKDKKGTYSVPKNKMDDFTKDMEELLEIVIKIEVEPIKLGSLGDNVKMAPTDLATLEKFIVE